MTFALTQVTGSGQLAYRLEVERWPISWVSHASMVNLAASPPRRPGLKVSGGKLKCIANIVSGELEVSGFSCSVTDLDERPTYDLARTPTAKTWLTSDLTSSATSLNVRSTAGFASSGTIWLDSETIHYGAVTATSFTGCTRGGYGSLAQAHYIGAGGLLRYPEVTDLPVTMAGCRARLYVYGQNDDHTGSGTLMWMGVVSRHPKRAGAKWDISVQPITSVLDRALSADLAEPVTPRGIYYPWNRPFQMRLRLATGSVPGSVASEATVVFPLTASDTAFFENNEAFIIYLNTKIASATSGWATTITAVADGDDGWHLKATTDGTARAVWFFGPGDIDPEFGQARDEAGTVVTTFGASTTYHFFADPASAPNSGSVPRGYYGDILPGGTGLGNPALAGTFPHRRIYLGGAATISTLSTAAAISWEEFQVNPATDEIVAITAISASNRYIECSIDPSAGSFAAFSHGFVAGIEPEIRIGRTYTENGSVWTMLSAIISAAAAELNLGSVPDLRSGDFSTTAWSELDAVWQSRLVRSRVFRSFQDAPIGDIVREELKMAGYALGLDVNGKIAPFRLRRPVGTEADAVSVPSFKVNKNEPVWDPSGFGMVNQVLFRRGYDPIEDEYIHSTDVVRDVTAFGQSPRPRTLKIGPKSRPVGPMESHSEVVELAARLFSILAYPYAIIQGDQGFSQFGTLTGDVVSITSPDLPNHSDGTVGVTDLSALVIGREVDLSSGMLHFTYYVPLQRSAGYAPEVQIVANSATNLTGNQWEIPVQDYSLPSGTDAADWFVALDRVRVVRWDSTTAGTVVGTVDSVTTNTLTVTFDGAWTPSTDEWWIGYAVSTDASLQTTQVAYVYLASSGGRIDTATDLDAWGFA